MIQSWYKPGPPLNQFIVCFWLYQGCPQVAHGKERLMPDGSLALVISLRDERLRIYDRERHHQYQSFRGALVAGAHSEYSIVDTSAQGDILGIQFQPGGAFPFFKLPIDELHNLHVSLEDLWGNE